MQFEHQIKTGKILKRYKRFLADIELDSGEVVTVHTANTGSMKTCWEPGWRALICYSGNPNRKYPFSLEMTHNGESWIGVNTSRPNALAAEAIIAGKIKELSGYQQLKREAKIGNSRIDILLTEHPNKNKQKCYVEIKNVTLLGDNRAALFPDAVSERGQKHLNELTELVKAGERACMLYIVQREDVDSFSPAWEIDPIYSDLLVAAQEAGVEILAYQCELNENGINIKKPLKINLES